MDAAGARSQDIAHGLAGRRARDPFARRRGLPGVIAKQAIEFLASASPPTGIGGTTQENSSCDALVAVTYDSVAHMLTDKQGYNVTGSELWKTVTGTYSDAGTLTALAYPNGLQIQHNRDAIHRLTLAGGRGDLDGRDVLHLAGPRAQGRGHASEWHERRVRLRRLSPPGRHRSSALGRHDLSPAGLRLRQGPQPPDGAAQLRCNLVWGACLRQSRPC